MKVMAELSVRLNARAPFSFAPQGIEKATSMVCEVEVEANNRKTKIENSRKLDFSSRKLDFSWRK